MGAWSASKPRRRAELRSRIIRPSLCQLGIAAALALGCASTPTRRTEAVSDLHVSALVVEQLRSSGGVTPDEVLALSARLGLRSVAAASGRGNRAA